jgi:hypothetical protein
MSLINSDMYKSCGKVLVIRASASNIIQSFLNVDSLYIYEHHYKNISHKHLSYNEIINSQPNNYSNICFNKIWRDHKRYILSCYSRESINHLTNLEIFYIAELHYKKIYKFISDSYIRAVIFEENPHVFMDVIFFLAAKSQGVECIYHEFFFQNTILIQRRIKKLSNLERILSTKQNSNKLIEPKITSKLVHFFKKKLALVFGGGIRWEPYMLKNGIYIKYGILTRLIVSLRRERYINAYTKILNLFKIIKKDDVNSRDIVVYFHFQPESSTMPYGGIYADQIYLCYKLAKKFPSRRIIIKEHPSMLNKNEKKAITAYLFRNIKLMGRLLKLSNIYFSNDNYLLSKCWISSINGTIIYERNLIGMKALVINNICLKKYSSRKTWFFEKDVIAKRGDGSFALDRKVKRISEMNLSL